METAFGLLHKPEPPRIILEHPPLVLAICQLRFSAVLGITDPVFVAPFQRAIQDKYPVVTRNQSLQIQFAIGGSEAQLAQGRPAQQWQFADKEDNWKVVLAPEALGIEARHYSDFDDFRARFLEVLEALALHIQPSIVIRLGLRYINEIRPEAPTWPKIIRQELLGPLAVPELIQNTVAISALQQLMLRYLDDQGITIHHGLIPGGTSVQLRQGESEPQQEFYLLDFDVFRDFPPARALAMDPEAICGLIDEYHKIIYSLFRWSVTDDYISTLGRIES